MQEQIKNLYVILDKPVNYSETFIKAHIQHLNARVAYASSFPYLDQAYSDSMFSSRLKQLSKRVYFFIDNNLKQFYLKRRLRKERAELMLAEFGYVGVKALTFCKKQNIPLVVHFHGYDAYHSDILEMYSSKYKSMFDYVSAIIVVSNDMRQQVLRLGAPANKIFYNAYGVDIKKFEKSDVINSKKQIISVGRFVEKKAPYLTVIAFKKVLDKIPDASLIMVGDGPLLDICRHLINALGITDNVRLLGALTHAQVAVLMQSSRAFVQHSLQPASGDSEGMPNTILEAQACGLPVISTKHTGIKEIVIQGETGYLVDEEDVDNMANCMIEILSNPELAAKIGCNGRKHVSENYTIEKSIDHLKSILNSCYIS